MSWRRCITYTCVSIGGVMIALTVKIPLATIFTWWWISHIDQIYQTVGGILILIAIFNEIQLRRK